MAKARNSILSMGLEVYLNKTADQHRDFTYKTFVVLFDAGLGPNSMAKAFNVSKNTMLKWLAIFHEEQRAA